MSVQNETGLGLLCSASHNSLSAAFLICSIQLFLNENAHPGLTHKVLNVIRPFQCMVIYLHKIKLFSNDEIDDLLLARRTREREREG